MKVTKIEASCKVSVDIKGNWYAYEYAESWELEKNDKVEELRPKLWDKVINETEQQIKATYQNYMED